MRVDEREILGERSSEPPEVREFGQSLRKEKIDSEEALRQILHDLSSSSDSYTPLQIVERFARSGLVPEAIQDDLYGLFNLYFSMANIELLVKHTNRNAVIRREATVQKLGENKTQRPWKNVNGGQEMCVFIGALLTMGFCDCKRHEAYWNFHSDQFVIQIVKNAMSLNRFEDIKRYLKVNDPDDDIDGKGFQWYRKVDSFYSDFCSASLKYWIPSNWLAVDEALDMCKARSVHTLKLDVKVGRKGHKYYGIADGSYLLNFLYTSKKFGVANLRTNQELGIFVFKKDQLSDSARVVIQLVESIPYQNVGGYTLVLDNFFNSVKLATELKQRGHGIIGTAQARSGYSASLLKLRSILTKEADWGTLILTTTGLKKTKCKRWSQKDQVLCAAFQDNFTVQYFITIHTPQDFDEKFYKDSVKRKGISSKNIHLEGLPFPKSIRQYNKHMGGIDSNAQMRVVYFSNVIKDRRFWWRPWINILMASVVNFYLLYKLLNSESTMDHISFQRIVAVKLLEDPVGRRGSSAPLKKTFIYTPDYMVMYTDEVLKEPNHHIRRIKERKYCELCRQDRNFISLKRKALTEIDLNSKRVKWTRFRPPQTSFVCSECGKGVCNTEACWRKLHGVSDSESEEDVEA